MLVADQPEEETVDIEQLLLDIGSLQDEEPESEVFKLLEGSGDLQAYKVHLSEELKSIEANLVSNYLANTDSLLSLYQETQNCESILVSMEETLSGFADSLRGVSDDIRQLQQRSEELSVQLKSRSETQEQLIGFIDSVIISPDLVKVICEEEDCGSARFLGAIDQLTRKLAAHASKPQDLASVRESGPELEKLKLKAIQRVRDFLGLKVNALKQPRTNIQILQRNVLVNLRGLTKFLKQIDNGVYFTEIWNLYVSTLSKQYSNQFKIYVQTLTKLQIEATATKADMIGTLEGAQGGGQEATQSASDLPPLISKALKLASSAGSSSSSLTNVGAKGNVFSISGREQALQELELEADAIVVVTEIPTHSMKYYPETLLRSHQKLLIDTASSEYLFLIDFFGESGNKDDDNSEIGAHHQRMFDAVFGKTLQWFTEHIMATLVRDSFDPVGLLLAVRILEYYKDLMSSKRKIFMLDTYFDNILVQMRERLRITIDMNTDSLRKIEVKKINPIPPVNTSFYVCRRFAEFSAALLTVVKSELVEETSSLLTKSIESLSTAFDAFLMALAKRFPSSQEQQVFVLNNLALVLSVFRERQLAPILPLVRRFEEKMTSLVSVFVEKNLADHFGPLIKTTVDQERGGGSAISLQECERLVVQFQQTWKSEINKTQKEYFALFSNFETASEILKSAMTQLLLYYTRFQKIVQARLASSGISSSSSSTPAWARQIVPSAVIMAEIKQLQIP